MKGESLHPDLFLMVHYAMCIECALSQLLCPSHLTSISIFKFYRRRHPWPGRCMETAEGRSIKSNVGCFNCSNQVCWANGRSNDTLSACVSFSIPALV